MARKPTRSTGCWKRAVIILETSPFVVGTAVHFPERPVPYPVPNSDFPLLLPQFCFLVYSRCSFLWCTSYTASSRCSRSLRSSVAPAGPRWLRSPSFQNTRDANPSRVPFVTLFRNDLTSLSFLFFLFSLSSCCDKGSRGRLVPVTCAVSVPTEVPPPPP